MKPENVLQTLTLFFNDIIGAVIPGMVILIGMMIVHVGPLAKDQLELSYAVSILIVLFTFVTGHLLLSLYSKCIEPYLAKLSRVKYARPLSVKSSKIIQLDVEQSKAYITFRSAVDERILAYGGSTLSSISGWSFNEVRNLAMSMSSEASAVARRFMFIALLCSGVGTALVVLSLEFVVATYVFPQTVAHYEHAPGLFIQVILLLAAAWFCFARGAEFSRRALSAPFSVAYANLFFAEKKEKKDDKS